MTTLLKLWTIMPTAIRAVANTPPSSLGCLNDPRTMRYATMAAINENAKIIVKTRNSNSEDSARNAIIARGTTRRESSGWLDSMRPTACVEPMMTAAAHARALNPQAPRLPRTRTVQNEKNPDHSTT